MAKWPATRKPSYRDRYAPAVREVLAAFPSWPRTLKADAWNEAIGEGPVTDYLPVHAVQLVDVDPEVVERAQARCPTLAIDVGDIRALPYQDARFDLVLDLSTIDHVEDPLRALREYERVLIPGGQLLLVSWVYLGRGTQQCASIYGGVQYFFDVRGLRSNLVQAGFVIIGGRILTPELIGAYGGNPLKGVDLHAYTCRTKEK